MNQEPMPTTEFIDADQEAAEFMQSLSTDAATPSAEFRNQMRSAYEEVYGFNKQSRHVNGLWRTLTSGWSISVISVMVVAVIVGVFTFRRAPAVNQTDNGQITAETKAVLAQVLANNSDAVLNLQANPGSSFLISNIPSGPTVSTPNPGQPTPTTSSSADVKKYQSLKTFNYSFTSNRVEYGTARTKCAAYGQGIPGVFETYQFYAEDGNYIKTISKDLDGRLQDLFIEKPEFFIHYKGGEFAAKVPFVAAGTVPESTSASPVTSTINNTPSDSETETTTSGEPTGVSTITNNDSEPDLTLFGSDFEVKEEERDGKKYYVITRTLMVDCNFGLTEIPAETSSSTSSTASSETSQNSQNSQNSKAASSSLTVTSVGDIPVADPELSEIITKTWIEEDTYAIVREDSYWGAVDDFNLIRSLEIEQESQTATETDVLGIFEMEAGVEIREFPIGQSDTTPEQLLEQVRDAGVKMLWPQDQNGEGNSDLRLKQVETPESFSETKYGDEYFFEREFYPDDAEGEAEFEKALSESGRNKDNVWEKYEVIAWFDVVANVPAQITWSVFNAGVTAEDLANELTKEGFVLPAGNVIVELDNEELTADAFISNEEKRQGNEDYQKFYIFEYEGRVIFLMVSNTVAIDSNLEKLTTNLKSLDLQVTEDYQFLVDALSSLEG